MTPEKYQELIAEYEQSILKYDHQYANLASTLLSEHTAEMTEEQIANIKAEISAFVVHTVDTTEEDNRKTPRLRPNNEFSPEQLDYYFDRSNSTTNPLLKQRYLDILWEKSRKFNRLDLGANLVDSNLEVANLLEHENEFEKIDCINRAMQIAVLIEKERGPLTDKSVAALKAYLKKLDEDDNIRFTLEVMDTIINFKSLFKKEDYILCQRLAGQAIEHFTNKDDNYTLRGEFIRRLHQFNKLVDPTSDDPKLLAKQLAQAQIDEARRRTDSVFVQQHFLTAAQHILSKAGLDNEANEIRLEIEALGKSDGYEQQFKEFKYETEIPQEAIDELKALLTKFEDTGAVISISPSFKPSWEDAKDSASKAPASISDMFNTLTIDENGMTVAVQTNDERKRVMQYYQLQNEYTLSLLAGLLSELIKDKSITKKNFDHQFKKIAKIDKDCSDSVQYGLKLFFKGDYYSASLILTTQLENLLYNLLPNMGISQYTFEKQKGVTQSPKTLGIFLRQMKSTIGDEVYEFLHYSLVDKANINLRNKVAHGKTSINSDNYRICVRLIQLYSAVLVNIRTK